MNHESLLEAVVTSANTLGYTPTPLKELHKTVCKNGFPIAAYAPLVLLSAEGEKERERLFALNVKFMCSNELSDEARAKVIARMACEAEQFVGLLADTKDVLSVEVREVVVEEQCNTVAGEVAVALNATVRCIECNL